MHRLDALIFIVLTIIPISAFADFDAGMSYAKKNDFAAAIREWRPLAEQGSAPAQCKLGEMYAFGKGVPQDYSEALRWFGRAADQGNAEAQYNLGKMHALGKGVPQNFEEAVRWYRRGADQGDARSQSSLANAYSLGRGVPLDNAEAGKWYRLAAAQGDVYSQRTLGLMYVLGKGVPQDESEAMHWLRLAANQGDPIAQKNLAKLPLYKIASEAADKAYEATPAKDASSSIMAIAMMKTTLHVAGYMRERCVKVHPNLQPEIDQNLGHWKLAEAHAINQAEAQWPSLAEAHPELAKSLYIGDDGLRANFESISTSSHSLGVELWCKKYFNDLASGIWRKRTPMAYAFLDEMP